MMHSSLGIVSPPPLDLVLRHLKALCTGDADGGGGGGAGGEPPRGAEGDNGLLDRWPFDEPPAAVFVAIFRYLDGQARACCHLRF